MAVVTPLTEPMNAEAFAALARVSRETLARFNIYLDLLIKWQPRVNLVGASTLRDPWRRHFWDSAQLYPYIPQGAVVVDLGSGAGFPGLVLALLGGLDVHLVEADQRKAAFLREAARRTGASITLHVGRAEQLAPVAADVVTARALAPVTALIGLAFRWLRPGGVCLFLKGRLASSELSAARQSWHMTAACFESRSDCDGSILQLGDLAHV